MNNNAIRKCIFRCRDIIWPRLPKNKANNLLIKELADNRPLMIARFGAVEIKAVLCGLVPPPLNWLFYKYCQQHLHNNAGFFPVNLKAIKEFSRLMVKSMQELDILVSWRPEEILFKRYLSNKPRIGLDSLVPIGYFESYTKSLKDKKVLVVHPYAETIEKQYREKREKLFDDKNFLSQFASLQTVKAVQTIAGNTAGYKTWFDALEDMEKQIAAKDFDIALLGCGAYGFPLAAYIKSLGKQAIHMGGQLQLLFGIKGKRWENSGFYNEYWVRPSENERPSGLQNVENGAYW